MIVVTGSEGFVGRRVVERLLALGHEVLGISRGTRPGLARGLLRHVHRDIAESIAPSDIEGASAVIHAAAYVPSDMTDAAEAELCWRTNALGTLNVIRAMRTARVPVLVHLSTGNAYATGIDVAHERSPIYPSQSACYYLTSKFAGEVFAHNYGASGDARVVILRPSSIYGEGMNPSGALPRMLRTALAGEPITVYDGGRHTVDFVSVQDVVDAVITCVEREVVGIMNIGSGRSTSMLELAESISRVVGAYSNDIRILPSTSEPLRSGFPALDIGRAARLLGYRPRLLEEGLMEMWQAAAP